MPKTIQPSFTAGEIAPQLYGRVDAEMYTRGLRKARNAIVHTYGGVSNRPGTVFIGPVKDHTEENVRLIPFQFNTTDQYMLEFGNLYMRVIRNDAHVVETAVNISAISNEGHAKVTTATAHGYSNGDEVFITDVAGMTEINGRRFTISSVTSTTFRLDKQFTGANQSSASWGAYTSGGTVARVFTLTTPYLSADLPTLKYTQSADTMTLVHPDYDPRDLTRTDHDVWSLTTITYQPGQAAPTTVTVTPDAPAGTTYDYAVTALNNTTFEESLKATGSTATGASTPANTISWTAAANAAFYNVYRKDNGLFAYIGTTEETSFKDDNITVDTAITPPRDRTPFSAAGDKPGAVSYYQQRQVYGGSTNQPDTLYTSKTGARTNMTISFPFASDDAITATLNAAEVNEIRHLVPSDDLLVFTSGAEWSVNSGGDPSFSQLTAKFSEQSQWGCSHRRPIKVDDLVLFVENGDARVRSMGFAFSADSYQTEDLNQLATHLLSEDAPDEYVIRDWCFQYFPEPRIHAVRSDGIVLTMTFDPKKQVLAWTTWDTEGDFEATASLRRALNTVEDAIYFVVKRTIDGNTVRLIERLHTRKFADEREGFFLDAGSSYDEPVDIVGIAESGDGLVITTDVAHGFVDGDVVEFSEILAEYLIDEFGNPIDPDFLNGHRFTVADATSLTFKLECEEVT